MKEQGHILNEEIEYTILSSIILLNNNLRIKKIHINKIFILIGIFLK